MKLSLDVSLVGASPWSATLQDWYARKPQIRRLWAIETAVDARGADGQRPMLVILLLDPTPDGDEISAAWMANSDQWTQELQSSLSNVVQLEALQGPLPDEFEVDGEGELVAAICWRESGDWDD